MRDERRLREGLESPDELRGLLQRDLDVAPACAIVQQRDAARVARPTVLAHVHRAETARARANRSAAGTQKQVWRGEKRDKKVSIVSSLAQHARRLEANTRSQ